ncbi:regulator of chromosome condensation 1/beta-lactamase-inhibitor protein II, partial [Ochromonadaceae sp. CCMP2298]
MLLSFGKADHGKLGHGDILLHRLVPTVIDALQDVDIVKTASMSTYSVAIDSAGAVYVWGTGGSVGVAHSTKADVQPQLLEALPGQARVVDVSCGLGHALFLLHTGRVYSWGNGGNGRLGLGDAHDRTEACAVIGALAGETVVAVQCGASHSIVLTGQGRVYAWGKNTQGQCGQGNGEDSSKPQLVRKLEDVVVTRLAAGWEHSLALTDEGRMYSWGCGYKDSRRGVIPPVLGLGHNECRMTPEPLTSIDSVKIIDIACGWDHCLALDDKGRVLSWGSGQNGKLGLGNEDNISIPCYIPTLEDHTVVTLSAGCEHTAVITSKGQVFSWGHGEGGRLGQGNNLQSLVPQLVG